MGRKLKRVHTIKEVRRAFDEIKSSCAGDTRFMAQASLFLCETLRGVEDELGELHKEVHSLRGDLRKHREKRPRTVWQQFVSDGMKAGKSMQQIAAEWNERKGS